jgi:hypothetical protein
MRFWNVVLILILATGVLAGCGRTDAPSTDSAPSADEASPVEEQGNSAQDLETGVDNAGYTGQALDASYEGALPVSSQLALGTFKMEGTANAVTPDQAKTLLPLWQVIEGGALQSDSETNAVVKQIEGAMTAEQLAVIAAMQLTIEDMQTWMQEQGVNLNTPRGAAGDFSEEERAARRATAQAGGGFGGQGGEDRQAARATAEASGTTMPGGSRGDAGLGQLDVLAEQVVELLTTIVGE